MGIDIRISDKEKELFKQHLGDETMTKHLVAYIRSCIYNKNGHEKEVEEELIKNFNEAKKRKEDIDSAFFRAKTDLELYRGKEKTKKKEEDKKAKEMESEMQRMEYEAVQNNIDKVV